MGSFRSIRHDATAIIVGEKNATHFGSPRENLVVRTTGKTNVLHSEHVYVGQASSQTAKEVIVQVLVGSRPDQAPFPRRRERSRDRKSASENLASVAVRNSSKFAFRRAT
jgi:hypothetical protein